MKWKEFKPNKLITEYAVKGYQAKVGEDLYISVYEYEAHNSFSKCYELNIQIPDDLSITGKVIDINNFKYMKKDYKQWEEDGTKIINRLVVRDEFKFKGSLNK